MKDLISFRDLNREKVEAILHFAKKLKTSPEPHLLENKILGSCFFEPSTRTRLSFEAAISRAGGKVIGFSEMGSTSSAKGESLKDSMKIIGSYADIIVIRHPLEGSARLAGEVTDKPVINAGDGANQHPTQTLLDLFSMKECQTKLEELNIAFVGDLKYGRTVHSLSLGCALFNMRLYFISPSQLAMPDSICSELRKRGVKFSFHKSIEEVLDRIDILYMTRIQKERFEEGDYSKIQDSYILKKEMLAQVKPNLKIFHPLPRVNEIDPAIDDTPYAYFFEQAANGIFVRQAILSLMLNGEL